MSNPPPFDAWLWMQASAETLWAGWDPAGVGRQLRDRRLTRLIEHTMKASPLYRRLNPEARTLGDFAPVAKAQLMANFDDWATDRRITLSEAQAFVASPERVADGWLGSYLLWTSSGTSGEPGIFVQDAGSLAAFDAIDAQRLRGGAALSSTSGAWGLGQRLAFVGATEGHFAGHVSLQRLRRLMFPAAPMAITSLSVLEPLRGIAARLGAMHPSVLITYPSCAAALAQRQLDGEMALALQEVWVGGEQLSAQQRQLIRTAFRCPLRNNYGASEFYAIASECPHGRLHVNDDWVILEAVDAHLQPVPVGTLSDSVLLTNLANFCQPLLRYRLTDRVRFTGDTCTCGSGFPVIEVQGRAGDTLYLHDAKRRPVPLLPLALETAIEEHAGVTHFQLLCHAGGRIEIRFEAVVAGVASAFERTRQALLAFLEKHGVVGVRISHSSEPPLLQAHSGKLLRVLQLP
jgi:phenylacetate-CoA ligase